MTKTLIRHLVSLVRTTYLETRKLWKTHTSLSGQERICRHLLPGLQMYINTELAHAHMFMQISITELLLTKQTVGMQNKLKSTPNISITVFLPAPHTSVHTCFEVLCRPQGALARPTLVLLCGSKSNTVPTSHSCGARSQASPFRGSLKTDQ